MRLRNDPNATSKLAASAYVIAPEGLANLSKVFGNRRPVLVEVGAGKGGFASAYARLHPEQNLLAVEKSPTVAAAMAQRLDQGEPLSNLRVVVGDFAELAEKIADHSVSGYFVNFCDP